MKADCQQPCARRGQGRPDRPSDLLVVGAASGGLDSTDVASPVARRWDTNWLSPMPTTAPEEEADSDADEGSFATGARPGTSPLPPAPSTWHPVKDKVSKGKHAGRATNGSPNSWPNTMQKRWPPATTETTRQKLSCCMPFADLIHRPLRHGASGWPRGSTLAGALTRADIEPMRKGHGLDLAGRPIQCGTVHLRNRIRHKVLPLMEVNPARHGRGTRRLTQRMDEWRRPRSRGDRSQKVRRIRTDALARGPVEHQDAWAQKSPTARTLKAQGWSDGAVEASLGLLDKQVGAQTPFGSSTMVRERDALVLVEERTDTGDPVVSQSSPEGALGPVAWSASPLPKDVTAMGLDQCWLPGVAPSDRSALAPWRPHPAPGDGRSQQRQRRVDPGQGGPSTSTRTVGAGAWQRRVVGAGLKFPRTRQVVPFGPS